MRRTSAAFAIALIAGCNPAPTNAPQPPATIVDLSEQYATTNGAAVCATRHPADMMMRAACARNAGRGRADFIAIGENYAASPDMKAALANCFERHTTTDGTDFMLAGACARNQARAFEEINAVR